MDPIISIENFAKSFGKHAATTDVSFTVNRGDIYGLLGRNGAGKSTTIRAMLSLISADSGNINLFGRELKKNRHYILSRVGCIIEKPDFYKYLSAKTNMEILARLSGKTISKSKIMEMLDFTGLKGRENDKVGGYSHGMRQRLGIAQALIHDPELIVLDEPTTGLDPQGIIDIRNLILQLKRDLNKTIILSSHILPEVELICNRMVIIDKGKTLVEGEVQKLLHADELLVVFETNNAAEMKQLLELNMQGILTEIESETRLVVHVSQNQIPEINKLMIQKNMPVYAIEPKRKLEDYFLKLLKS